MRLFVFLLFFSSFVHAQSDTTIRFFFDFDSYQLKTTDNPFRQIDTNRWQPILVLSAQTDTTGSSEYNRYLADFRLNAVKALLRSQRYFSVGEAKVVGESYALPKNYHPARKRCVTVTFTAKKRAAVVAETPATQPSVKPDAKSQVKLPKPGQKALSAPETTDPNAGKLPRNFNPNDSLIAQGDVLILNDIEFELNETIVTLESYPQLQQLLQFMKDNPSARIHIRGHVCCAPAQFLSDQRALKIYNYLVDNGISASRMTHKGYSNKLLNPLYKADPFSPAHRRVEIEILER